MVTEQEEQIEAQEAEKNKEAAKTDLMRCLIGSLGYNSIVSTLRIIYFDKIPVILNQQRIVNVGSDSRSLHNELYEAFRYNVSTKQDSNGSHYALFHRPDGSMLDLRTIDPKITDLNSFVDYLQTSATVVVKTISFEEK
jgi:hypothetical protein